MLSIHALSQWLRTNRISPKAQDIIKRIRKSSELHSSYCDQDSGRSYFSEKMEGRIRTTPHALYQTAVILLENDPDVLEYWPLIASDTLVAASKRRRFLREPTFPYFFVIRSSSAGWEQFDFDEQLNRLSRAEPRLMRKDEKGVWHQSEIESRASILGLYSHVYSWSYPPPIQGNFIASVETRDQLPNLTEHPSNLVDSTVCPTRAGAKAAIERFFASNNERLSRNCNSDDLFPYVDECDEYVM